MPATLMMHRLSDCVRTLGQGRWVLVKLCPSEAHNSSCHCTSDAPEQLPLGMTMVIANVGELPEAAHLCAAPWGSYVLMHGLRHVDSWDRFPGFDELRNAVVSGIRTVQLA